MQVISPVRGEFVSLSIASAMTGLEITYMERLIARGSWQEGRVYRIGADGSIEISIPGYEDWAEGKSPVGARPIAKVPAIDRSRPTKLYRHYDADGTLLYIGISLRAAYRLSQHMAVSHWADRIARITVEQHPNRPAAELAETTAINQEKPLFNIAKVKKP